MTKDEALRLAWDALQQIAHVSAMDYEYQQWAVEAITAIKEALTNEALDKMAENARELGLDYEPPQRTWFGLTDKDWNRSKHNYDFQKGVDWAESILKEKNA